MPKKNDFVDYLVEMLAPLGEVRARAMFGGWGIYQGDRMFGLVADDTFYLKTDDVNRPEFVARGLGPFVYQGPSRSVAMSYHRAPDEAMEDADLLCEWARRAVEAAGRQAVRPKKRGPKRK